ncbi:MAG: acyloxyacyl hydrolase [Phycisphaerales bacterium]|nr:acyloxyacyl hydrolase [Phycisphaerales bacterium]
MTILPSKYSRIGLALAALGTGAPASAWADSILDRSDHLLQPTDSIAQPSTAAETQTPSADEPRERRFGRAGSWWWSVGSGVASNFGDAIDTNIHGILSTFLADELEFGVETAGWYFNQEGPDTGGLSASMIFRWHFAHDREFRWTVFGDAGIGLLAGFDDVPDGGTSLNFLPRLGLGFTHVLGDDPGGARLTLGARWHHISNARIEGEERNPARDSLMAYFEIQFPF